MSKRSTIPGRKVRVKIDLAEVSDLTSTYYSGKDTNSAEFEVVLAPGYRNQNLNIEKVVGEVRQFFVELLRVHDKAEKDIEDLIREQDEADELAAKQA